MPPVRSMGLTWRPTRRLANRNVIAAMIPPFNPVVNAFYSALEGPFLSPYNVAPERPFVMFSVRRLP